jgi:hypothetical protein
MRFGHGLPGLEAQTGEGEMGQPRGLIEGTVLGNRGQPARTLEETDALGRVRRLNQRLETAREIVGLVLIRGQALGDRTQDVIEIRRNGKGVEGRHG